MSTTSRIRAACLLAVVAVFAPVAPATAQAGGTGRTNGTVRRPAPANFVSDLSTLAQVTGQQYQVRIVVDPLLTVPAKPVAPQQGLAVDKAVQALTDQAKNAVWRRVYLPATQAAAPPSPIKMANAVRSLDTLEQSGLVIEDPSAHKATSYMKGFATTPNFADDLAAQQFSRVPVYVIYAPNPYGTPAGDDKPVADRFLDLQRQQMEMMMQMTPDQMSQAMGQGLQMYMNMDPAVRSQFMGNMMRAGMQMFMNMPADQRQELINSVMQNMQGMFGPGGPGGPGGGGRGPGG